MYDMLLILLCDLLLAVDSMCIYFQDIVMTLYIVLSSDASHTFLFTISLFFFFYISLCNCYDMIKVHCLTIGTLKSHKAQLYHTKQIVLDSQFWTYPTRLPVLNKTSGVLMVLFSWKEELEVRRDIKIANHGFWSHNSIPKVYIVCRQTYRATSNIPTLLTIAHTKPPVLMLTQLFTEVNILYHILELIKLTKASCSSY